MAMKLNFASDSRGFNAYAPDFADVHKSATLENGDEQTFTVPGSSQVWIVSFSIQPGTNIWVARNATAEVPTDETFTSTDSELNPGARKVYAGDVIHCITDSTTADVGLSFYAIG